MPVTKSRSGPYETNLDQTNTARFLFGEDEPNLPNRHTPDHSFPTLVRRDDQMVSATFLTPGFVKCCSSRPLHKRNSVPAQCSKQPAASRHQLVVLLKSLYPAFFFLTR